MKHTYGRIYKPISYLKRSKSYNGRIAWTELPWPFKIVQPDGPYTGVLFLGYCYVVSGQVVGNCEDGRYIIESKRIKVALVSYDPRCNPVYVLPSSLQSV